MLIKGTTQEIGWALEGFATTIPCGECPYEKTCSELYKKEDDANTPIGAGTKCEDILRMNLTLIVEE